MEEAEVKEGKRIRNFPVHNLNPYSRSGKPFITEDRSVSLSVIGENGKDECHITTRYTIDGVSFLGVLCDNLRDKLCITRSGTVIFQYLYNKIQDKINKLKKKLPEGTEITEDQINKCIMRVWKVAEKDVKKKTEYSSHQSIVSGIGELLYVNVIARSLKSDVYYVNPAFFKPIESLMVTEYHTSSCKGFKKVYKDEGIRDFDRLDKNPYQKNEGYNNNDLVNIFMANDGARRAMSISNCNRADEASLLEMLCDNLHEKFGVNKGGVEVFRYMYKKVKKEINSIQDEEEKEDRFFAPWYIDSDEFIANTDYTTAPGLFNGVSDLLDANIIARSGNSSAYFINPAFFKPSETLVLTDFYKIKKL